MAKKKLIKVIKLQVQAGKANPAPPVGPALGSAGINIMDFCKQFNAKTQKAGNTIIPVVITVYQDRSFTFITKTPPTSVMVKESCNLKSGSKMPQKDKVAKIKMDDVRKIAETKLPDLNCVTVESAMNQVIGTCKSMGVEVVG